MPSTQCEAAGEARRKRPKQELAEIFRQYGDAYRAAHKLPVEHLKIMRSVVDCRTEVLGGHLEKCQACGHEKNAYNSCLDRHCPKCQTTVKARWIEARKAEVLPVGYFHAVFTLPHELNPLILVNKKVIIGIFFKAVFETLLEFGQTHLGGKIGVLGILHTWNQKLLDHFHLHCVVPAGALANDGKRWRHANPKYLFSHKALAAVYRGKFLDYLQQTRNTGALIFPGRTAGLATPAGWKNLIRAARKCRWVVHVKEPFANPDRLLEYLARYTHRVAISNDRILSVDQGQVTFAYRDRKDGDKPKRMTLPAAEFMRRYLLHSLPAGLMRIRYGGIFANRAKANDLAHCRDLLAMRPRPAEPPPKKSTEQLMRDVAGVDIKQCLACHAGRMAVIAAIPSFWMKRKHPMALPRMDSS